MLIANRLNFAVKANFLKMVFEKIKNRLINGNVIYAGIIGVCTGSSGAYGSGIFIYAGGIVIDIIGGRVYRNFSASVENCVLATDNTQIGDINCIPLYLFGMLY